MTIDPTSFEFQVLFYIMISVCVLKLLLSIYLGNKIRIKTKKEGKFELDFLFGFFFFIVCIFICRVIWVYWDFFMTQLDPNTFYLSPNIEVWKLCATINSIGYIVLLLIADIKAFGFKFKGIFAYLVIAIAIIRILYPINSMEDFQNLENIGSIELYLAIVFPVIFIYIGIKADVIRKIAFTMVIGIIIYVSGSFIIIENIAEPLREIFGSHIVAYTLFAIFKFIGLILMSMAAIKFYNPKKRT